MSKLYVEYAEEIKVLFKNISNNLRNIVHSHVSEYGFTVPQILLMHELYHTPDLTLIELSKKLGLAKSTVSGIIDRLEKQEVVIRTRAEDDRRTVKISLAPKMYHITENLKIVKSNYLADVLKDVEQKEIEQILQAMQKLNNLIEGHKSNS